MEWRYGMISCKSDFSYGGWGVGGGITLKWTAWRMILTAVFRLAWCLLDYVYFGVVTGASSKPSCIQSFDNKGYLTAKLSGTQDQ